MSRHIIRKLIALKPGEWADLLRAQAALVGAQVLVWTRPAGALIDDAPASDDVAPDMGDPTVADRLALAVGRAAEHGVLRPACLVRALALHRLLESRGIRGSRIRVGVRTTGGRFVAHAWVELRGRVLGDRSEHVGTFAPMADVRPRGAAR